MSTNDDTLAARARRYRDQGKSPDGARHELWGNSWRITEVGAAIGVAQLRRLDKDAAHRLGVLHRYHLLLTSVPGISLPGLAQGSAPSGYKCVAVLAGHLDRAALKTQLAQRGVQLGKEVYETPLHRQPLFTAAGPLDRYPKADGFCARHICLPIWRHITAADVDRVVDVVTCQLTSPPVTARRAPTRSGR